MNLIELYPNKVSYYDEIELGTIVFAGNGIAKWIDISKHTNPTIMQVIAIIKCDKQLTTSAPECAECKTQKWYKLGFLYNSTPFCDMCSKTIYDTRGRKYEMR